MSASLPPAMSRLHGWQQLSQAAANHTPHVVSKANELMLQGKVQSAVDFLNNFAGPDVRPAVHAFLANYHVKNEKEWLGHINRYLEQYNVVPLELKPGKQPRFFRLFADPGYAIEEGPLVSVIVSAFNAERTIEMSVTSVLNQTWKPLEIIIIDDRSTDRTFQIAQKLSQLDSRIRVFQNAVNVGPYVSRNRGLLAAHGTYVTTQDADDWAFPQRFEMQLDAIHKNDLGAVIMRAVRMNEKGQICRIGHEGQRSHDGVLQTSHVSAMFDMALVRERLGHWDCVRFAADSEFLSRTTLAIGSKFREILRPCQLYSDNPGSLTNHPVTGTRERGTSPIRTEYRSSWKQWHATLAPDTTYLPLGGRKFTVPEKMQVSDEDIRECLDLQRE